jgi:hypothetical protein
MKAPYIPTFVAILALSACAAQPLPSERIGGAYQTEVAGLRASLSDSCTPAETEILLEGLAILADASERDALSAGQRAAIPERDAAFRARLPSVSPGCRAALEDRAGPSPVSL